MEGVLQVMLILACPLAALVAGFWLSSDPSNGAARRLFGLSLVALAVAFGVILYAALNTSCYEEHSGADCGEPLYRAPFVLWIACGVAAIASVMSGLVDKGVARWHWPSGSTSLPVSWACWL